MADETATLPSEAARRVTRAVALIAATPGYTGVAADLEALVRKGRVRFVPDLPDRGQATLTGRLLLGPEALNGSTLGLAETLVHEHFHLRRQRSLEKTVSFWSGVATGRPVMRRYETPAYRAALDFLRAVAVAFPNLADEARAEQAEILSAFAACYGGMP